MQLRSNSLGKPRHVEEADSTRLDSVKRSYMVVSCPWFSQKPPNLGAKVRATCQWIHSLQEEQHAIAAAMVNATEFFLDVSAPVLHSPQLSVRMIEQPAFYDCNES
mmetsp:Transcript_28948/g.69885  ORF Transcript_28948/g.69885 Transcript_28948/m.69885 type:complete len:106 (+) Transcript_28948:318-635(+)